MSMHYARNLFKEYPNPYFVETGSYTGDSIQLALDAGFKDIRAIEINKECVQKCRERFKGQPVSVFEGDSAYMLFDVINEIHGRITFWLDSHWQMLEGEKPGEHPWPLFWELNQISHHKIKEHTIIIDDMLYLTHPDVTGWTKKRIEERILQINPRYKIEYFANPIVNNILVASV